MGELRHLITRYANARALDVWVHQLQQLRVNRYEQLALRAFFEESRRLIRARDAIDTVRDTIPASPGTTWGWQYPNSAQQRNLFEATKVFFDTYYSSLSALSGVVARFNRVFHVNFSDNAPFVRWLSTALDGLPHNASADLERARLFRALLNHPQQFPVFDWATACYLGYEHVHIVLHGPAGRGKNPIPRGATSSHDALAGLDDWQFDAPDEVTITNSFFNAGVNVVAEIISALTRESALVRDLSRADAISRLIPVDVDVSPASRRAVSEFEGDGPAATVGSGEQHRVLATQSSREDPHGST